MAAHTFRKRAMGVTLPNSFLSPVVESLPEGASQTFPAGSPVVLTAGLIVAAASPATAIFGFALEAGHNTTGARVSVVRLGEDHELIGNLHEGSVTDHALAAADLGSKVDLILDANYLGTGLPGWYLDTPAASGGTVEIVSFEGDEVPNVGRAPSRRAQVGDINARVRCRVLTAVLTP